MTCANYLDYACPCGGECLQMAKVKIYEISFDFADWGLASAILVVTYVWLLLLIWGARNLIEGLRGHAQAD